MSVFCGSQIFTLILVMICVGQVYATRNPDAGPFKAMLVEVRKCQKPSFVQFNKSTINLYVELYNTSTAYNLLRGNLSVTKETRNAKIQLKMFMYDTSKWKLIKIYNNIGCHGTFMIMLISAFNINYDRNKCAFLKGHYSFNNIDNNKMLHSITSTVEYGRVMWKAEIHNGVYNYYCWEFEGVITPEN